MGRRRQGGTHLYLPNRSFGVIKRRPEDEGGVLCALPEIAVEREKVEDKGAHGRI